ncbi:MAG: molybdopterin-dependent oxidoreductase [Planctomycetes bacterium]|nr:molybdopterin-dependent oxidoreductase [Planctomycetota bacterium]
MQQPRERLPIGQHRVERLPVVSVGGPPRVDTAAWSLRVHGAVAEPYELSWSAFQLLPRTTVLADFHAALGWSVFDLAWCGVLVAELVARAQPSPRARFVRFSDGELYDASLPLDDALATDVLLAHLVGDEPLAREHGGPVRLVVPKKYGWKSVKWVAEIELCTDDRPGFWERRGRPIQADPWRGARGF